MVCSWSGWLIVGGRACALPLATLVEDSRVVKAPCEALAAAATHFAFGIFFCLQPVPAHHTACGLAASHVVAMAGAGIFWLRTSDPSLLAVSAAFLVVAFAGWLTARHRLPSQGRGGATVHREAAGQAAPKVAPASAQTRETEDKVAAEAAATVTAAGCAQDAAAAVATEAGAAAEREAADRGGGEQSEGRAGGGYLRRVPAAREKSGGGALRARVHARGLCILLNRWNGLSTVPRAGLQAVCSRCTREMARHEGRLREWECAPEP